MKPTDEELLEEVYMDADEQDALDAVERAEHAKAIDDMYSHEKRRLRGSQGHSRVDEDGDISELKGKRK